MRILRVDVTFIYRFGFSTLGTQFIYLFTYLFIVVVVVVVQRLKVTLIYHFDFSTFEL